MYVYCRNNPLKYTDPNGRLWHIAAGAIVGSVVNSLVYWATSSATGTFTWEGLGVAALIGGISGAVAAGSMGAGSYLAAEVLKTSWSHAPALLSAGVQVTGETLSYGAEKIITHEPIYLEEYLVQAGTSLGWSYLSSKAFSPIRNAPANLVQTSHALEYMKVGYEATIEVAGTSLTTSYTEQLLPYPWTTPSEPHSSTEPAPAPHETHGHYGGGGCRYNYLWM